MKGAGVDTLRDGSSRVWLGLLLVFTLFLAGSGLGFMLLRAHRSPEGLSSIGCPNNLFGQAVMVAAGRGSFHPKISAVPGLAEFLDRRTVSFDPATLPSAIPTDTDSIAEYHVYLGWTVALLWRVFGISWRVVEPFLAVLLGISTVCVYGLFRLGMKRLLSVAGTVLFATSPAVLDQLHNLRDFSKAPFLLAGMFVVGWLITRRTPSRMAWLMVALLGFLTGLGMGFRQDAIILVPVSLAAILLFSPGTAHRTRQHRIGAALVYLFCFLMASAPMVTRMEGGAQPYHPLAQGYSMKHMDRGSLAPGVCEPLACSHDNFIFATIFSHARRVTGNEKFYFEYSSTEDAQFTRDWVIRTAMQFPADTIARGYGTVLNVLSDADAGAAGLSDSADFTAPLRAAHRHIALFFRLAGPAIAVLALMAAAAAGPRLGLALLLLTLYFCGYVSLDNEWRHTFHLSFVSFWAAGFLLQQALTAVLRTLRGSAQWGPWLRRAGVFLVFTFVILWFPWQAARLWQRQTLGTVMRQYASAPRAVVPTTAEPMQDWTLFRMTGPVSFAEAALRAARVPVVGSVLADLMSPDFWETRCHLYAVSFRTRQSGRSFMAKYWAGDMHYDFSQVMRVAGGDREGGTTWFFFPAYEFANRAFLEGIAVPSEDVGDFLGLFRVADDAQPSLLPCVTVNEGGASERLNANLEMPYDAMRLFTPENEWTSIADASERAEELGRLDAAILYARAGNALKPSAEQGDRILALCERAERTQDALRLLKMRVVSSGGDIASCAVMCEFLERKASEVSAPSVWEELAQQAPSGWVLKAYEESIDDKDLERRITVLRQLWRVAPDELGCATRLQGLLREKAGQLASSGDLPGVIAAYAEAIPLNPANNEPILYLERVLSEGSPVERKAVWEAVWAKNPDNPRLAALCGAARAATGDLVGAKGAFDAARRLAPEEWSHYVLAADALASAGAWDEAATAYDRALAINPKLEYLRGRLEEARKRAADSKAPEQVDAGASSKP